MSSSRIQSRQRTTSSIAPLNDYLNSLEGCVSSLNACNYRMDLLLSTLNTGINDFPRIQTVLANKRHFEVVSETDIQEAQRSLEHEVYPQILELLERAEAGITKLERREKTLQGKSELQEVRLQQKPSKPRNTLNNASEQLSKANELHALQVKKERLLYSLNRLSLIQGNKGQG